MNCPELSMYNDDCCLDICRDDRKIGAGVYEVVFEAEGARYYCYVDGCDSLLEALGLFFENHPNITYNMVVNHEEV